ncbi:GAF domain-containing protein [Roseovarius sp. SCSIO 43702]|uniref:histidine kinase dimerization/phosphoacceptor domain -containing protein n=1 Tax=Roseovarius sp. SCSIO 43702 TaxID=2823043 RepID=UPI001C734AF4|nr:histidine kinase dimerization/phosphoacceptor domain -containing protein [Roseovarius sp. SCSIO 43702]QYX57252.1 GAF domain-containing protein [Roseovarius sp. SCSIO 43702]
MRAPTHPKQDARLETLRGYEILDTPREKDFDDIVSLVSRICEAPISVINLIDAERQWFKAEVGLGVRETPLETSICSHVILQDDFVEISDTLSDPRMADNPLCLNDPGLRFYAGARLVAGNGLPIGTLCVLDYEPRTLTELQRDALRVLARQVMRELDLRLALKSADTLRAEIDHRVKNSLQTIGAVVRLHARKIEDDRAREALAAVERRVEAVAALHGELQTAVTHDRIAMNAYLPRIGQLIQRSAPPHVTVSVETEAIMLDANLATPVAVVMTEFAANSIKHGFPDERGGTVQFRFLRAGKQQVELRCEDDGVGSGAAPADESRPTGIGFDIVDAAAQSLGATLHKELTGAGSRMTLRFPAG